ncbi:hypothetical protein [Rhizobium sp. A37_96]
MKIAVIGTGYVDLVVSGADFAEWNGHGDPKERAAQRSETDGEP